MNYKKKGTKVYYKVYENGHCADVTCTLREATKTANFLRRQPQVGPVKIVQITETIYKHKDDE